MGLYGGMGLSLANTLQGVDVNTLTQALDQQSQQLVADAAARAAQAQGSADQAGNAYQAQAAAPPPMLSALDQSLPGLFGSIASILSGNPSYQKQAQENTQISQSDLVKNRLNTLQALRDKYNNLAEAAQQTGNHAANVEYHEKIAKVESQQAQILKAQQLAAEKEQNDATLNAASERQKLAGKQNLDEIAARGVQDRLTNAAKPKSSPSERAAQVRQGLDPETGLMLSTVANREVTRRFALAKRGDEKTRNEALSGAIDIASQRWHTDKTPRDMAARLVRMRHPFYKETAKDARYALTGEKIYRKQGKEWVEDDATATRAVARAKELTAPWFQE